MSLLGALGTIAVITVIYEGGIELRQNHERHSYFNQARDYADSVGKPLLTVGMKRRFWEPSDGDVTIDIDPEVEKIEGGVIADVRSIPFEDKYFGACYCSHVLEHMETVEDAQRAVDECVRVSDISVFLCPSPYSIIGNFFCPAHHLRIWFDPLLNRIRVKDNSFRTGIGPASKGQYENKGIGQALVSRDSPEIVKIENAIVLEPNGATIL